MGLESAATSRSLGKRGYLYLASAFLLPAGLLYQVYQHGKLGKVDPPEYSNTGHYYINSSDYVCQY